MLHKTSPLRVAGLDFLALEHIRASFSRRSKLNAQLTSDANWPGDGRISRFSGLECRFHVGSMEDLGRTLKKGLLHVKFWELKMVKWLEIRCFLELQTAVTWLARCTGDGAPIQKHFEDHYQLQEQEAALQPLGFLGWGFGVDGHRITMESTFRSRAWEKIFVFQYYAEVWTCPMTFESHALCILMILNLELCDPFSIVNHNVK